jgi:peptidyl-prolyl cis-trans isomerase SDCCAG10
MSQVYINEPPTHGKVCLETSVGEIEIELFSRECPKTCRNFVQVSVSSSFSFFFCTKMDLARAFVR